MTRHINALGRLKIKQWEGVRLEAYHDSGGVLTIGYGHTGPEVKPGLVISEVQADAYLAKDLAGAESAVEHAVTVPLTDNQFAALVSFTFNVGASDFKASTLLKKLNKGDYASVPAELARWTKVKGRTSHGLVNRRAAEAGLWATGAPVASVSVTPVAPVTPTASPTNWIAIVGTGIPAAATAIKGVADSVNSTFTQLNDGAGAVKNAVTTVHETTGTVLGAVSWHLTPTVLIALGVVSLVATAIVVYRHSRLREAVL